MDDGRRPPLSPGRSAEQELAAARARLAAIAESSDDAIVSKTLDGVVTSWNAGAERIFGWTAAEAVGRSITLVIPPERLDEERVILEKLRRGERINHFETVRVAKDGRRLDISLTVSPIRDADGRVVGASKVARDVTDRKRADERIRASEGRLRFLEALAAATRPLTDPAEVMAVAARLLAEQVGADRCAYAEVEDAAVYVITGDHARAGASIVGRWPVAAFGAEHHRLMLAGDAYVVEDSETDDRIPPADREAYRATEIRAVVCVPLHKDGRFTAAMAVHQRTLRRWTPAEVELVATVAGRCWETLERARANRALRESEARYRAIVEATPECVKLVAPDGTLLQMNRAGLEMIEGDESALGACVYPVVAPEHRAAFRAFNERVCRGEGGTLTFDIVGLKGTRRHMETTAVPLPAPAGGYVQLAVTRDVTAQTRANEALREADRRKDEFLAVLAHELRNPLAPLRNGLEVIRLAGDDPAAVAKARAMMDRQLGHMVRLIDDLLDVSRITRGKMTLRRGRVALADAVGAAVETARPLIDAAGHALTVALPPDPVVLDADLTRLAQVFANLLTNAAKYTPRGGRIALTAERRPGEVAVAVRDTGVGVPPEHLAGIFDMFSQVDRTLERSAGGLGIGLALVRGLVEMHGGSVAAASDGPGAGSTFTVRLPVADVPAPAAPAGDDGDAEAAAGRRILVADDNRDAAASLAALLRLRGNEVRTAHDGAEAVTAAETFRPDAILMDVGMPRLNGYDAARRIRERPWGRGVRIIALTGWGQEADRERSRAAGCDGHLVKPVALADLDALLAGAGRR
jgi:PAS domain S-box-containing protein